MLLLFGLLLWLPIRLEIDTEQQIYRVSWQGIFAFWVVPEQERWRWFFSVFFWQKEWNPSQYQAKIEKPAKKKKPSVQKRKFPFSIQMGQAIIRNILRAIKIQRFRVNWDTGDFVLNAWLYPAFRMASRGNRQLFINFSGEQKLAIRLQTRLGLLAIAALRIFINTKNH